MLESQNLNFIPEYCIRYVNDSDNKIHWKFYDFLLKDFNILIEVNGDFWHANPNKFKADDIIFRPHFRKNREPILTPITAKDIWEIDEFKRKIAEVNNFTVFYLWESDIRKMTNEEIFKKIKDCIDRKDTQ